MKKMIAFLVCITALSCTTVPTYASDINFSINIDKEFVDETLEAAKDVGKKIVSMVSDISDHWAISYIKTMIEKNIVTGYSDGSFKPDNTISIAEFTTILIKQTEYQLENTDGKNWFDTYIETAKKHNIIDGADFGQNVDYNRNITRAEMALMIFKVMDLKLVDANYFTDDSSINASDKHLIYAVANTGIIGGYPDGSFRPNNQATRAEACVMLNKMMKYEPIIAVEPIETVEVVAVKDSPYPEEIFKTFPKMDLWSDEEFEEFLLGDVPETFIARGKVTDISLKRLIHEKPYCYFDPGEGVFYFRTITGWYDTVVAGQETQRAYYDYIKYDDGTNQKIYDTVKILLQHTKEHGKFMSVRENSRNRVKIMVGYDEHISHDFYDFFVGIDAEGENYSVEKHFTESTDFTQYVPHMQFGLWSLIDNMYFPQGWDVDRRPIIEEANYMEDFYQEALYQLVDHFYKEDTKVIYDHLISEYYESRTTDYEIDIEQFEDQEVGNYKMFFIDYNLGYKTYLIYEQK